MAKRDGHLWQSSSALLRNGLKDFRSGNYARAIETWERVGKQTPDMQPASALAEAYFRSALGNLSQEPQAAIDDLGRAVDLQPNDPTYTYHLALALHRHGEIDRAAQLYRTVWEQGGELAERAAYPLTLSYLQQGEDPAESPAWSTLSPKEQAMLQDVGTFQRRPYSPSSDAPPLLQGLAALDADEFDQAREALDTTLTAAADPSERRWALYYRGVLAGREEDWKEARRRWVEARKAGLATPRLTDNLGEAYHRLAEERLVQGDPAGALEAAREAHRYRPDSNSLAELISQCHQRLASRAVAANRWSEAREHWETAERIAGGSFRLAYNLALAYERSEDFGQAAEKWREALRRRPRSEDHPDAVDDEQVAQLWRRTAETYVKDDQFDEAVNVYRNAVKWNPEHLPTRLDLVQALLINGQIQAAENELNRILERDPECVPALIRMGEVLSVGDPWWRRGNPTVYWDRALELEPDNLLAQNLAVDFCLSEAEDGISWGAHANALEWLQKALEYQPDNGRVRAAVGGCYLRMGEMDRAHSIIDEVHEQNRGDLAIYRELVHAWLDVGDLVQAWEEVEAAEAAVDHVPYDFYLGQLYYCAQIYPAEAARPWAERAVEKAPPDAPIFLLIGDIAVRTGAVEIGVEYLERAIVADQDPGQAYLMLAALLTMAGDREGAREYLEEAEKIARRTQDADLRERVDMAYAILFPGSIDYFFGDWAEENWEDDDGFF